MNIYVLSYKAFADNLTPGILTFTNKKDALKAARYYRDNLNFAIVALRHDKKNKYKNGACDIEGFIEF